MFQKHFLEHSVTERRSQIPRYTLYLFLSRWEEGGEGVRGFSVLEGIYRCFSNLMVRLARQTCFFLFICEFSYLTTSNDCLFWAIFFRLNIITWNLLRFTLPSSFLFPRYFEFLMGRSVFFTHTSPSLSITEWVYAFLSLPPSLFTHLFFTLSIRLKVSNSLHIFLSFFLSSTFFTSFLPLSFAQIQIHTLKHLQTRTHTHTHRF